MPRCSTVRASREKTAPQTEQRLTYTGLPVSGSRRSSTSPARLEMTGFTESSELHRGQRDQVCVSFIGNITGYRVKSLSKSACWTSVHTTRRCPNRVFRMEALYLTHTGILATKPNSGWSSYRYSCRMRIIGRNITGYLSRGSGCRLRGVL